jgi:glucose-1-phosphate thymidylyltransferase
VIESLSMSTRGEFEITDVLNHFVQHGHFFAHEYQGHWTDAGTVPSLLRASAMAAEDDQAGRLVAPSARPVG